MTRRDGIAAVAVLAGLALVVLSVAVRVSGDRAAAGKREGSRPISRSLVLKGADGVPSKPLSAADLRSADIGPARPNAIDIPALKLHAQVAPVDTGPARILTPPPDVTAVGWWAAGAWPGSRHGTTLFTGHTVHTGGGAFDHLGRLRPGQPVIVERPRRDLVYRVASVNVYRKGKLAQQAGAVFSQTGPNRLALVTCNHWNGSTYLSNVVVLARIVAALPGRESEGSASY